LVVRFWLAQQLIATSTNTITGKARKDSRPPDTLRHRGTADNVPRPRWEYAVRVFPLCQAVPNASNPPTSSSRANRRRLKPKLNDDARTHISERAVRESARNRSGGTTRHAVPRGCDNAVFLVHHDCSLCLTQMRAWRGESRFETGALARCCSRPRELARLAVVALGLFRAAVRRPIRRVGAFASTTLTFRTRRTWQPVTGSPGAGGLRVEATELLWVLVRRGLPDQPGRHLALHLNRRAGAHEVLRSRPPQRRCPVLAAGLRSSCCTFIDGRAVMSGLETVPTRLVWLPWRI
jgi:hypothetical protein